MTCYVICCFFIPHEVVAIIDGYIDACVARSGCVPVRDVNVDAAPVTDMCTLEQAVKACKRCIPRVRFEAVKNRRNVTRVAAFGHIPIRFSNRPVALKGHRSAWSHVRIWAEPQSLRNKTVLSCLVVDFTEAGTDGHDVIRTTALGENIFESYKSFCRRVGDVIMSFKRNVLVKDIDRLRSALQAECDATVARVWQGLATFEETNLRVQELHNRYEVDKYQFPLEDGEIRDSDDDISYNKMFELTRLTPVQLALFVQDVEVRHCLSPQGSSRPRADLFR